MQGGRRAPSRRGAGLGAPLPPPPPTCVRTVSRCDPGAARGLQRDPATTLRPGTVGRSGARRRWHRDGGTRGRAAGSG